MSGSIQSNCLVFQVTSIELPECSHWLENKSIKDKQATCCDMKETVDLIPEDTSISSVDEKDSVTVPDADLGSKESVNSQASVLGATSVQADTLVSNEVNICQELSQSLTFEAKAQKSLSKSKTFPAQKETIASSASGASAYSRSISLPSPSTLVSAMKGSRALNGVMVTKPELHVKWAPEVYDPPSTSMSHTVNGHNQRIKNKRKEKHKSKGKAARRNGGDKKHGNRKNAGKMPEPFNIRFQGSCDGVGKSRVIDIFE